MCIKLSTLNQIKQLTSQLWDYREPSNDKERFGFKNKHDQD